MSEWQPIETAPKDGTRILTFRKVYAEEMAVVWFSKLDGWLPIFGTGWPNPTHWMPLPEPPKS